MTPLGAFVYGLLSVLALLLVSILIVDWMLWRSLPPLPQHEPPRLPLTGCVIRLPDGSVYEGTVELEPEYGLLWFPDGSVQLEKSCFITQYVV